MHEGTDIVKLTKIQNLNTAFETICGKDNETFDEFNAKHNDIVNLSFNLGEPIPDHKVFKKILRSLPRRLHSKVVAIEEHTNLNELVVEELVGNLQAFEANYCSNKKSKGLHSCLLSLLKMVLLIVQMVILMMLNLRAFLSKNSKSF